MKNFLCRVETPEKREVWAGVFAAHTTFGAREVCRDWFNSILLRRIEYNGVTLQTKGLTIEVERSKDDTEQAHNVFMGEVMSYEQMDEVRV